MTSLVITREVNGTHSLFRGPMSWGGELQRLTGLRGNATPPPLPYTRGQFTLRVVTRDLLTEFQEYDEGSLDGGMWHYSARLKSLADLKTLAKDQINNIYQQKNSDADQTLRQSAKTAYDSAVSDNWSRRKTLLDSVDEAANLSGLNSVWQSRDSGWYNG